jgi:hypothetical protein
VRLWRQVCVGGSGMCGAEASEGLYVVWLHVAMQEWLWEPLDFLCATRQLRWALPESILPALVLAVWVLSVEVFSARVLPAGAQDGLHSVCLPWQAGVLPGSDPRWRMQVRRKIPEAVGVKPKHHRLLRMLANGGRGVLRQLLW